MAGLDPFSSRWNPFFTLLPPMWLVRQSWGQALLLARGGVVGWIQILRKGSSCSLEVRSRGPQTRPEGQVPITNVLNERRKGPGTPNKSSMQMSSDYVYTEEIKMENISGSITSSLCHTLSALIIFIFALPPYLSLLRRGVVSLDWCL